MHKKHAMHGKKHHTGKIHRYGHLRPKNGHKQPASTHATHAVHNKLHGTAGGFQAPAEDMHGPLTANGTKCNEYHE